MFKQPSNMTTMCYSYQKFSKILYKKIQRYKVISLIKLQHGRSRTVLGLNLKQRG